MTEPAASASTGWYDEAHTRALMFHPDDEAVVLAVMSCAAGFGSVQYPAVVVRVVLDRMKVFNVAQRYRVQPAARFDIAEHRRQSAARQLGMGIMEAGYFRYTVEPTGSPEL